MSGSVHLQDLLAKVRDRPRFALSVPREPGQLIVRSPDGERYVVLRLNQHSAVCWHRELTKRVVVSLVRDAVEAGHSVTIDDVESVVPSRYRRLPERFQQGETA